ncbi:MAG: cobalt transporter CbiM [Candidatus Adiutrix sp.]|jgi:cobalt/nickel transport system permease protein|nr:cobalt transporter CbiM [Candidatus Adiutrix sp.]
MHISEGVLSGPILAGGAILALGGLARGLRELRADDLPRAALLAAVFFTASLIHVSMGFFSAHLLLNGLLGLLLGWAAFPVIFIGLLLQGVLLQYGGLTVLGVNTFNMAGPAAAFGLAGRAALARFGWRAAPAVSLLAGGGTILFSGVLTALSLGLSGQEFAAAAAALGLAHLPVAAIEALVTLFAVQFLRQVRPGLLGRTGDVRP